MTNVYFVRHCEPNYSNQNDIERELTLKGIEDRELVTKYLADKNIDIVISTPYKRAIDTVKHFADKYNLPIEIIEDFKERKLNDVWIEDFNSFCKAQWMDFTYKLSQGESLGEVQKRNVSALFDVISRYNDKNIVVGSHGTALSTIINYFNKSFLYNDFEKIKNLFPWIVKFSFEESLIKNIEYIDVFTNKYFIKL